MRFKDEEAMRFYLGYLKYKELLVHLVEQVSIYMRNNLEQPIDYVVSPLGDPEWNFRVAFFRLNKEGKITFLDPNKLLIIIEKENIRRKREGAARILGYTQIVIGADSEPLQAKPIDAIEKDSKLQHFLDNLNG